MLSNQEIEQLVNQEISNYELQVDKLTSICNLFLQITNVPVSVLISLRSSVDHIKNNDIAAAVNILEKTSLDIQSLSETLVKSIQILKQEM